MMVMVMRTRRPRQKLLVMLMRMTHCQDVHEDVM